MKNTTINDDHVKTKRTSGDNSHQNPNYRPGRSIIVHQITQ